MPSDTLIGAGRNSPLHVIEESVNIRLRGADEQILLVQTTTFSTSRLLCAVPVFEQQVSLLAGDVDTGERRDGVEAAAAHNRYQESTIADVPRKARFFSNIEDRQCNVAA